MHGAPGSSDPGSNLHVFLYLTNVFLKIPDPIIIP